MLTIQLAAKNHAVLDESVARVLKLVPEATLEVLPRASGEQRRKVEIQDADDKLIAKLAKLDLSHEVRISVR